MKKTTAAEIRAKQLAKVYKTKDDMARPLEGGYFTMRLRVEDSGIFRQGWLPDELDKVELICKGQSAIEHGTLVVVVLKGVPVALLRRVYENSDGIVLEVPTNLDKPDEHIPPIVLSEAEAAVKLTILGKVVRYIISLKDNSNSNAVKAG